MKSFDTSKIYGNRYIQALSIGKTIKKIAYKEDLSWQTIYDLVFELNKEFRVLGVSFEWTSPDTSCEEDVYCYLKALDKEMEKWEILIGILQ